MENTHSIKHLLYLDRLLVKAIRAGGEVRAAAWDYIMHYWTDYFVGTIRRKGGTEEDARELISDVFEPVERALCKDLFRYEAPLQIYINRAVLYRWYALLRLNNKISSAEAAEAAGLEADFGELFADIFTLGKNLISVSSGDPPEDDCMQLALQTLKKKTPLKYMIFTEFEIEDSSQREIANRHGKALQTVKNYVSDAKKFIRKWFKEHPDCRN